MQPATSGAAVVLHHMRRDIEGAQIGHMIGGVIGLIFANRYAAAGLLGLFHWLAKNGNKVKNLFLLSCFSDFPELLERGHLG